MKVRRESSSIGQQRQTQRMTKFHASLNVSCHHGDSNYPNILIPAKNVISQRLDINIVEIDMVTYDQDVISSHDYTITSVSQGSTLFDWIHFVIYIERRVLWLDVKENQVYTHSMCHGYTEKFNVALFFETLDRCRKFFQLARDGASVSADPIDISQYILIGCQDAELAQTLRRYNTGPYHMIMDLPRANYYVWQTVLPSFLQQWFLNGAVQDSINKTDFREIGPGDWVALDMSFFETHEELREFIIQSPIPRDCHLIIYTAKGRDIPIEIEGYHIIMQYDYTSS